MAKIVKLATLDEMTPSQLNDWYEGHVGYRPQEDSPSMTDDDLRALCKEYKDLIDGLTGDF